jgi:hypothetical protein
MGCQRCTQQVEERLGGLDAAHESSSPVVLSPAAAPPNTSVGCLSGSTT